MTFFVDSGAGQCLCSVSSAFSDLQPCCVEVTGVAGSLPIHGFGTANFVALDHNGNPLIVRIPNCLYGRCEFNLLSVSQVNQVSGNRVDFSLEGPAMILAPPSGVLRSSARVPLALEDGLFSIHLEPLEEGDMRFGSLPKYTITLKGKFVPSDSGGNLRWQARMLATASPTACLLGATSENCHDQLGTFCDQYLAPPSIPPARRLYDVQSQEDMAQLSIRFLGASADRLIRTVEISNGLKAPASKRAIRVPPLIFPQGRLKTGKSPKVSKGKVGHLKHAGIGEVVCTDTFESGNSRKKYCQVFYDIVSRFGYVTPMRSKTEIGDAFADFCCQCWVPLILIRDNAGENIGGSLIQELRNRNVQSAFICPHRSQQNFAEGYIGRITVMASFGMVFAGAPLFMWVHAIKAAAFISNITATFYSKPGVWATPYELVHGERCPDASVVVPFGCAALILLDEDEQAKFKSRCVLMLFMHYADRHPLFTYAFYSPKTKRIVFRQDCLFLPTLFPMRHARSQAGMHPDGERLVTYRSPGILRDGPQAVSFRDWSETDPLPSFDDDVSGFELYSPGCFPEAVVTPRSEDHPSYCPDHQEFEPSFVRVPAPTAPTGVGVPGVGILQPGPVLPGPLNRKSTRVPRIRMPPPVVSGPVQWKRVTQRWFYEEAPAKSLQLDTHAHVVVSEAPLSTPFSLGPGSASPALALTATVGSRNAMGVGEGDPGRSPPLSPSFELLQFAGTQGDRFTIVLVYPGGERDRHDYTVFPEMPVSFLRHNLACLLRVDAPVSLFVGPMWLALDHSGTITDPFFPGSTTPCPYVMQGSVVRVQVVAPPFVLRPVDASTSSGAQDVMMEDTSGWGAPSTTLVSWGRQDPPPHPDEGIGWSTVSDRAARTTWDLAKGAVSPPPRATIPDLFSDRGDGFSLMHLRRNGEDAASRTICLEYVSSGSSGEQTSDVGTGQFRQHRAASFPHWG